MVPPPDLLLQSPKEVVNMVVIPPDCSDDITFVASQIELPPDQQLLWSVATQTPLSNSTQTPPANSTQTPPANSTQTPFANSTQTGPAASVVISSQPRQNQNTDLPSELEVPKLKIPRVSFDSDGSDHELENDALNKKILRPKGNTLRSEDRVLKVIKHIINSHFDGPWVSFSKVPKDTKKLWWREFEKQYFWKDRHASKIKAIWRSKCSQHLRNTFFDARKFDIKPPFVSPENWIIMKRYWDNDDKFKQRSETNAQNRAVERPEGFSNYTGGSRSIVENVEKIEKDSGRRMTQEELVMAMYHSKKQGKYTDDRAQKNLDAFHALCEEWMTSHLGEAMPQEVINKLWLQATRDDGSARVYGQGLLYRKADDVFNPTTSQSPSLIGSPPIVTSPFPLEERVHHHPRKSPALPPIEIQNVLTSPSSLEGVQQRPLAPPQPYFPSPPSPHNVALLAQAAPSLNENETQQELEYYNTAHKQQQEVVQLLLSQINQGGVPRMNTSRSSTMQDSITFQEYMNSGGQIMEGGSTDSFFPNIYGNE